MRWSLIVPLVVLAGGAPVQPSDSPDCDKHQHPFLVPADSAHALVRTIALRGTFSPLPLGPELEPRMQVFDTMIEAALRYRGYQIIDARITDSVWNAAKDSVGPMFDAVSGQRDSLKWQAAHERLRGTLHEVFGADAILYPSVRSASAKFAGQTAKWDGTKQSAVSFGSTFVDALAGGSYSGTIPALSLRVGLFAIDGTALYDNVGGIQLAARTSHGQFRDVPDSLILTDRERMAGAVKIALCQFLSAPPVR